MCKKVMIGLIVACALAVGSAQATVVFFDDFDSQPLGALGTSVPTGIQWYHQTANIPTVVDTYAQSGTQSLKVSRAGDPVPTTPSTFGLSAGGTAVAGNELKFSFDILGAGYDSAQVWLNFGGGLMGGFVIQGSGFYGFWNNGTAVASALKPTGTDWDKIEMLVHLTDAGGGLLGGTYDAWITKAGGTQTQIATAYALVPKGTDGIARIQFQEGYGYTNYVDNVMIEVVPEPATLTMLGLGIFGLLRRKK